MRSILKHSSLDSPTKRPFSPECVPTDSPGSILKNDSRNRKITISPDPPASWGGDIGGAENNLIEPKPILKHQTNELKSNKTERLV